MTATGLDSKVDRFLVWGASRKFGQKFWKGTPSQLEAARCALLGNSFACSAVAFILGHWAKRQGYLSEVPSIATMRLQGGGQDLGALVMIGGLVGIGYLIGIKSLGRVLVGMRLLLVGGR